LSGRRGAIRGVRGKPIPTPALPLKGRAQFEAAEALLFKGRGQFEAA
jgi:hypothetical protein